MTRKKPPPDNPGNLAGRARQRRELAWARACGGIRIIVGPADCKSERAGTYPPPDDVRERYRKELAALNREAAKPKPKKKPKVQEPVSFFTFAKER